MPNTRMLCTSLGAGTAVGAIGMVGGLLAACLVLFG
jgi:hypothetical protein